MTEVVGDFCSVCFFLVNQILLYELWGSWKADTALPVQKDGIVTKIQQRKTVAVLFQWCLWEVRIERRKKGQGLKPEVFCTAVSCAKYSVCNQKNLFSFLLKETDLLYAAKVYRDDRLRKKAESMSMENCKELERLTSLYRGGWATVTHTSYLCCYLSWNWEEI